MYISIVKLLVGFKIENKRYSKYTLKSLFVKEITMTTIMLQLYVKRVGLLQFFFEILS